MGENFFYTNGSREDLGRKLLELARENAQLKDDKRELVLGFGEACVALGRVVVEAQQEDYTYLNFLSDTVKIGFTPTGEPTIDSPLLVKHNLDNI